MSIVVLWLATAIVFVVIDVIWLAWLGRGLYVSEIGGLLKERPDLLAAIAFYALYVTGLVVFVARPALAANSIPQAIVYGAFFGLVAYGTYDLTNLAVLKDFTARIALIDMAWGALLSGLSSAIAVGIAGQLLRGT